MTDTPMTKEAAQAWIDSLGGSYASMKGIEFLCDDGKMCCLGVLADMHGDWDETHLSDNTVKKIDGKEVFPGNDWISKRGLTFDQANILTTIDDRSSTFAPVIAKIKEWFIDGVES